MMYKSGFGSVPTLRSELTGIKFSGCRVNFKIYLQFLGEKFHKIKKKLNSEELKTVISSNQ